MFRNYTLRFSLFVVTTIMGPQLGGADLPWTRSSPSDYPVIQAVVVVAAAAYILIDQALDVLYSLHSPRTRVGGDV